jgi:hypothetical protein
MNNRKTYEALVNRSLFTPDESAKLLLAAIEIQHNGDGDKFITLLERIFVDKLFQQSEQERLLGLTPKSS